MRRIAVISLMLLCALPGVPLRAQPAPPNLVAISPTLVTSGQPSAAWLRSLKAQGFEAVIYLAPFSVPDAVREEPDIVAAQGLQFLHLPVRFDSPSAADFEAFAALLRPLYGRKKVLVHCQVNMRASTLTFLYRSLHDGAEPQQAYEAVARVWTPSGPWKRLLQAELSRHGIAFDPF